MYEYVALIEAGVAQSVQRLAKGWTTEVWSSGPGTGKNLLHHVVQSSSVARPASFTMDTGGGAFLWGEAARAWSSTFTSKQCRGQEDVGLYVHSSIRLQEVVPN
jgi:hypothetical protein